MAREQLGVAAPVKLSPGEEQRFREETLTRLRQQRIQQVRDREKRLAKNNAAVFQYKQKQAQSGEALRAKQTELTGLLRELEYLELLKREQAESFGSAHSQASAMRTQAADAAEIEQEKSLEESKQRAKRFIAALDAERAPEVARIQEAAQVAARRDAIKAEEAIRAKEAASLAVFPPPAEKSEPPSVMAVSNEHGHIDYSKTRFHVWAGGVDGPLGLGPPPKPTPLMSQEQLAKNEKCRTYTAFQAIRKEKEAKDVEKALSEVAALERMNRLTRKPVASKTLKVPVPRILPSREREIVFVPDRSPPSADSETSSSSTSHPAATVPSVRSSAAPSSESTGRQNAAAKNSRFTPKARATVPVGARSSASKRKEVAAEIKLSARSPASLPGEGANKETEERKLSSRSAASSARAISVDRKGDDAQEVKLSRSASQHIPEEAAETLSRPAVPDNRGREPVEDVKLSSRSAASSVDAKWSAIGLDSTKCVADAHTSVVGRILMQELGRGGPLSSRSLSSAHSSMVDRHLMEGLAQGGQLSSRSPASSVHSSVVNRKMKDLFGSHISSSGSDYAADDVVMSDATADNSRTGVAAVEKPDTIAKQCDERWCERESLGRSFSASQDCASGIASPRHPHEEECEVDGFYDRVRALETSVQIHSPLRSSQPERSLHVAQAECRVAATPDSMPPLLPHMDSSSGRGPFSGEPAHTVFAAHESDLAESPRRSAGTTRAATHADRAPIRSKADDIVPTWASKFLDEEMRLSLSYSAPSSTAHDDGP